MAGTDCPLRTGAARRVDGWTSSREASGASRCRCRRGRGTSTRTSCPATTAGRSSTPGSACPTRRSAGRRSSTSFPGPVARIVVTHFHPDHVGAATRPRRAHRRAGRTGAPRLRAVRPRLGRRRLGGRARRLVPPARRARRRDRRADRAGLASTGPFIRYQPDPELLERGDAVDGWEVVAAPGHADGQLMLLRDGVLVAADHLLDRISPTVGLWPAQPARPARRLPRRARGDDRARADAGASPGTASRSPTRPGGRERSIAHHRERLAATAAALGDEPRSAYEVSFPLFGSDLKPAARRFAVAETLSHLERLVHEGGARRHEAAEGVDLYCAPEWTASYRPVPAPRDAGRPFSRLGRRDERRSRASSSCSASCS